MRPLFAALLVCVLTAPAFSQAAPPEKTGYWHPFIRLPKDILDDQKAIWTSPFHTAKKDIKWWAIFGSAEAALLATDKWTVKQLPNTAGQVHLGNDVSVMGAAYTLIPIAASFYFVGTSARSERLRETGILSIESLIDSTLVETVIKSATLRARPLDGNRKGGFWDGHGPQWNASFPSGHSFKTFAVASVVAHEYSRTWWVKALAYGYAGSVAGARLAARRHFPGDVVAGGVMGWFIGDYVYNKRHNSELARQPGAARKILDHVRFRGRVPVNASPYSGFKCLSRNRALAA